MEGEQQQQKEEKTPHAVDSNFPLFSKTLKRPKLQKTQSPDENPEIPKLEKETSSNPSNPDSAVAKTSLFSDLGLSEWALQVCKELGMKNPTQVQSHCIPKILSGRDVLGLAQTGSGKTAAFALPILHRLAEDPYGVFALVITPTRELAYQLAEQFRAFGSCLHLRCAVVVGGMDSLSQAKTLMGRPHVVIATPGRIKVLLENPDIRPFLVLDEADRVIDVGFQEELRVVFKCLPKSRQTLLFSATMTSELQTLLELSANKAYFYEEYEGFKTVDTLNQQYIQMPKNVKEVYLVYILSKMEEMEIRSAIIFVSACRKVPSVLVNLVAEQGIACALKMLYISSVYLCLSLLHGSPFSFISLTCRLLSSLLKELDHEPAALHSLESQSSRLASLHQFKSGQASILIATDLASRGLDIPTVDLVINYDLPRDPTDYVHRVGRTARAGRKGLAVSLVAQHQGSYLLKMLNLPFAQDDNARVVCTNEAVVFYLVICLPFVCGIDSEGCNTLHDGKLMKAIEAEVGKQFEKFECKENEVLSDITKVSEELYKHRHIHLVGLAVIHFTLTILKALDPVIFVMVYKARRVAKMKMMDDGFDELVKERKKQKQKSLAEKGLLRNKKRKRKNMDRLS
ncbi:hypothetical protein SADUNF_Sadunf08G0067600 [Salix dunnii]|uniref:Uncharacterized protein n=1 Tax=Salix dunnii TaxID=1413687 RepID=A0A835JVB2_9ROSI|nr:hypothetical protein SADUNF_Sadunf08G0067600 [Salix dunnii]